MSLVEALSLFNRKERNLLICRALGRTVEKPPLLNEAFRKEVRQALGIDSVPPCAWWAIDYHLNWIAGALAYRAHGGAALDFTWDNLGEEFAEPKKKRFLLEGNQEDVDLVIAFGDTLILCEAKGYQSYSNEQSRSKAQRMKLLFDFYREKIEPTAPVQFHFLHLAPKNTKRLETLWPDWIPLKDGKPPFVRMCLPDRALSTTRCDAGTELWGIQEIWNNDAKPESPRPSGPCSGQRLSPKQ